MRLWLCSSIGESKRLISARLVVRLHPQPPGIMFIRFISGEIDDDSHVPAGLFCAAYELRCSYALPQYELDALDELRDWFNLYLESPLDYLPRRKRYDLGVCWFKSTAREHLTKAWELVTILERNDVLIWTIRAPRTGYVYYEDAVQVFAVPYYDSRRRLTRLR